MQQQPTPYYDAKPSHNKPLENFVKTKNKFINPQYIKSVICNDYECEILIANTARGQYQNDKIIKVSKDEFMKNL